MERLQRNKWTVIFFMLLSAVLCAIMAIGITVASGDNARSLVIAKTNLAFEDNVYILYAVDSQGIENKEQIKVLVWDEPQEEYVYGDKESVVLSCYEIMDIDGKDYALFVYDKLSAKQMTDEVFAVAYYDGIYSEPVKYSVLQYAHKKIQESEDQNFKNMLTNMLAYGASAQVYYDYNTDTLATDTYYTVKVESGRLSDGFTKGLYKSGAEVTIIAEPKENEIFKQWSDGDSNIIGQSKVFYYIVEKNITLCADYVATTPDEYFTFTLLSDDTYEIKVKADRRSDLPNELVVPSSYNGKAVTSIGDYAFTFCGNLTSIIIPNNVTSIGYHAFYYCENLRSITIPDSVTKMDGVAISCCFGLANIIADQNNEHYTSIDGNLYSKDGQKLIKYAGAKVAREFIIPDSVTSIGILAFEYCQNLRSITIPDSVANIWASAFTNCSRLSSIYYGGTIEDWNCINIFGDNSSLLNATRYYYSENYPAEYAENTYWHYVDGVPTVWNIIATSDEYFDFTLLDGDTYEIKVKADRKSDLPAEVILPSAYNGKAVTNIGNYAFHDCSNLTIINIPNSITCIGESAFLYCSALTSITIPNSVISIGPGAFCACKSLTSITIPDGVTSIGSCAFELCSSLTSITIGCSVKSIGDWAFYGCGSLMSLTIPDSVTSIGDWAFKNCSSFMTVYYTGMAETWHSIAISEKGNDKLISATRHYCNAVITDEEYFTFTLLADGTYEIEVKADRKSDLPAEVILPSTYNGKAVKMIGQYAFNHCSSLKSITIPGSVVYIEYMAFANCSSLTSVNFGDNSNVTDIETGAFHNCVNLTNITMPSNIVTIKGSMFQFCSSLTSVTMGDNVNIIEDGAFAGCSSLTDITISNSVTTIESYVFHKCSNLTNIIFNGTKEQWGAISKGSSWKNNVPATVIHCTDGDVAI